MITLLSQRDRVKWQSIGHAPVGYAIEEGVLDEEEGMYHPDRHVVSNVLGQNDMRIALGPRQEMAPRDTVVLCSDDLSDNVPTDELTAPLRSGPLAAACKQLVRLAESNAAFPGKPDDLTVIAARRAGELD